MSIYERGDGVFYLWHLQQLGLISRDLPNYEKATDGWQNALAKDTEVRVAIIDNGCTSLEHPNLDMQNIVDPIEFVGYIEGATYAKSGHIDGWGDTEDTSALATVSDIVTKALDNRITKSAEKICPELEVVLKTLQSKNLPESHHYTDVQSPSDRFSAHGTACTGLIAGTSAKPTDNPNAIKYWGVNPKAKIIPINTVYNSDYWPLIMGLLYAVYKGAHVILMPRAVANLHDPLEEDELRESPNPRHTRLVQTGTRTAEKKLFEVVLKAVSDLIPCIIAAGNSGGSELEYPASLSEKSAPNIISVGAVTASATLSSYSSGGRDKPTIFAAGDDGERIDTKFQRFDQSKWRVRNLPMADLLGDPEINDFTPYGVLALDIPSQYGYTSDPGDDMDYFDQFSELGSELKANDGPLKPESRARALYCVFGGTSAASALVAGMVSLIQMQKLADGERHLTGEKVKQLLTKKNRHAAAELSKNPKTKKEGVIKEEPISTIKL